MVRIKLVGAAVNAIREAPVAMAATPGAKACGAGAVKLVNAEVARLGLVRGAEAEGGRLALGGKAALAKAEGGRLALAGKGGLVGKGALARGAEVEGARLVGMTKMAMPSAGAKVAKTLTMAAPTKVVVTKAAATGASVWGAGSSVGFGLGAGALGPVLVIAALGAIGVGIYVGVRHAR